MTFKTVSIVCVLLEAAVLAQSSNPRTLNPRMQAQVRVPKTTAITCQAGRYAENGVAMPARDTNCGRLAGSATAIAIDVLPSSYAYVDNPPCAGGDTDATTAALARTQLGGAMRTASPEDVLNQLRQRASLLGRDAPALIMGVAQEKSSRCQLFVLRAPVSAAAIRLVEFRAHQNQTSDNPQCMQASVKPTGKGDVMLTSTAGGCAIGWSGWQSAVVLDDPQGGAVVAGVFKNWSNDRVRTGQLWIWYQANTVCGLNTSATPLMQ